MAQTTQENDGWGRVSVRNTHLKKAEKILKKNKSFGTVGGLLDYIIRRGLETMEAEA